MNAILLIKNIFGVELKDISEVYETEPVGYKNQGKFLNMAIEIETNKEPLKLLEHFKFIEECLGRKRDIVWGPRTIDIDILIFEHSKLNTPELTIPHKHMLERAFVLVPLRDIYKYEDIEFGRLLETCCDKNDIKKHEYDIKRVLTKDCIIHLRNIDSTNSFAKKIASAGCDSGTVIVADHQTDGRGRLGRSFSSSNNKGLWMSIILRPDIILKELQIITLATSVAVTRTIKEITGIEAMIKWPNDIMINGKKICGILTEMNSTEGKVNFVVIGIGINVNQELEDFEEELRKIATSIKISAREIYKKKETDYKLPKFDKIRILKVLLRELDDIFAQIFQGKSSEILSEWKASSITLGKRVQVKDGNMVYVGFAENITEEGRLVIRCSEGVIEVLSGEVVVKSII